MSLRVTEFFGETKVDNVNLVSTLPNAHQEIIGLDIAVNEIPRVDVLDTGDLIENYEKMNKNI